MFIGDEQQSLKVMVLILRPVFCIWSLYFLAFCLISGLESSNMLRWDLYLIHNANGNTLPSQTN